MTERYILTDAEEALYRRSRRTIAPSRVSSEFWEGHWDDGRLFSREQLYTLATYALDAEQIDHLDVIAPGQPNRIYLPGRGMFAREIVYFSRRIPCPILKPHGDRLRVIAPNGREKLVYPDGSLTRAKQRRAA